MASLTKLEWTDMEGLFDERWSAQINNVPEAQSMFNSLNRYLTRYLMLLFLVNISALGCWAEDEAQGKGVKPKPFPYPVKLLGFITHSGSTIALVEVNLEPLVLTQHTKHPLRLTGVDDVNKIWFDEPVDLRNLQINIGFPDSNYGNITCRLGKVVQPDAPSPPSVPSAPEKAKGESVSP